MADKQVDVAIIGTGTAGMGAYRQVRARTQSIALIEGGQYGTTCARVGCMPSKLLIAAAEAAHDVAKAPRFGVHPEGPLRIDGREVMQRVRSERDRFVGFVLEAVEGFDPAHRIKACAKFTDPHTLALDSGETVKADRIVIATGSRPVYPGFFNGAGDRLVVNDDVFDWDDLPGSVAVFGGGVIGLELGQALARLGVRVRAFGKGGGIGPISDPAVRDAAIAAMEDEFPFDPDADVTHIGHDDGAVVIRFNEDGREIEERFDYLLAATGRKPNLDTLDIEKAGLEMDARGVPVFDKYTMRAGDSHIFIAGDVSNRIPLLHEAADDGRIAGENAVAFPEVLASRRRTPLGVMFTDPNIATVGRSYAELVDRHRDFAVGEVDFSGQGRSRVMLKNKGLLRLYGEHGSGLFLGAEMVGPRCEHVAHLLAWVHQQRMDVPSILDLPFYHPVIEEGLRTALRDLNKNLRLGPESPPNCIDCGPGA